MVDAPNGGGFLEIETSSKTFVLRSNDSKLLHMYTPAHSGGSNTALCALAAPQCDLTPLLCCAVCARARVRRLLCRWRRELYELLPYLRATEMKCGWLLKKGEGSNAGFKKRYCVLFSSYRLLYFDSEACTKRKDPPGAHTQCPSPPSVCTLHSTLNATLTAAAHCVCVCHTGKGAVDLSVADSVDAVQVTKGHGFEISTPGRTWVFAADVPDEMTSWMSTLRTMLSDIQVRACAVQGPSCVWHACTHGVCVLCVRMHARRAFNPPPAVYICTRMHARCAQPSHPTTTVSLTQNLTPLSPTANTHRSVSGGS